MGSCRAGSPRTRSDEADEPFAARFPHLSGFLRMVEGSALASAPPSDRAPRLVGAIRTLFWVYLAACLIGGLTLRLPHGDGFDARKVGVIITSGIVLGAVMRIGGERLPPLFPHAAVLYANVAITSANLSSGQSGAPYVAFLHWMAVYAGRFFSGLPLLLHLLSSLCGLAVSVFAAGVITDRVTVFAAHAGALVVSAVTVSTLWERLAHHEARLRRLAREDELTGLGNRRSGDDAIAQEVAEAGAERPFALLLVDVDHFKAINDTLGHAVGDEVLAALGRLVASFVRREDAAFRFGGEEFVLLLRGADGEGARVAAERLRELVAATPLAGRRITVSIGVVACTGGVRDAHSLLRAADGALYAAKRAGRNRVVAAAGAEA